MYTVMHGFVHIIETWSSSSFFWTFEQILIWIQIKLVLSIFFLSQNVKAVAWAVSLHEYLDKHLPGFVKKNENEIKIKVKKREQKKRKQKV